MPADAKPQDQQQPETRPARPQERTPGLKDDSVVTEASDNSFPASDPPAWTTGAGTGAPDDEAPPKERTEP